MGEFKSILPYHLQTGEAHLGGLITVASVADEDNVIMGVSNRLRRLEAKSGKEFRKEMPDIIN